MIFWDGITFIILIVEDIPPINAKSIGPKKIDTAFVYYFPLECVETFPRGSEGGGNHSD